MHIISEKHKNHSGVSNMTTVYSIGDLQFHLSRIKEHYQKDLPNEDISELNNHIECVETRRNASKKINSLVLEDIVKKHWIELNLKAIDEMLDAINGRTTKGSEFSELMKKLNDVKKDLKHCASNSEINTLKITYEETLYDIRSSIIEKITIEQFNDERYKKGLLWGFVLGVFASLLVGIFLLFIQVLKFS